MAVLPSCRAPRLADVLTPPFAPPLAPPLPPEERSFLDAVLAQPDDDEPRHAIADWYAASGNPGRAHFIRAQLAGKLAVPNPAWAAMFEPWAAKDLHWHRGFVEGMSLAGRAFISLGEPLFRLTPLRALRLVAVAPYMEELAATPHLAQLEVLSLRGNHIGLSGVQTLLSSPYLRHLHTLDLTGNALGPNCTGLLESLRQRGIDVMAEDNAAHRHAA